MVKANKFFDAEALELVRVDLIGIRLPISRDTKRSRTENKESAQIFSGL